MNIILKFFLSSIILLTIGWGQYAVKFFLKVWFPLKVAEFIDLCSVANVSVFILHDALHGYYVHGKSPYYGLADLNAEDLKRALVMEK